MTTRGYGEDHCGDEYENDHDDEEEEYHNKRKAENLYADIQKDTISNSVVIIWLCKEEEL